MAAQISVADWALLTGRVDAAEQGLRSEQEQRGQLIEQLRAEFSATQVSWAAHSARLEELREQLTALRATLPGGAAGPAGAALLDPRKDSEGMAGLIAKLKKAAKQLARTQTVSRVP